jgi:hypothetical protein
LTVKQLIAQLKKVPQTAIVAVSRDEEGKGFSELYQISQESMGKYDGALEPSDNPDAKKYIVLWPSH